nr:d 2 hydroxyglutarate dehydrogenase [Hymenolepis microstoma]
MNSLRNLTLPVLSKAFQNPNKLVTQCRFAFSTLTQSKYQKRRPDLGTVGDYEASHFERIFDNRTDQPKCVLTKPDEVVSFNRDYTGRYEGSSSLVVLPTSAEQVAEAVKLCNIWKLGILPQGGNTSLVGSSTPSFDEVIMSTRKLNKILSIDTDTGIVVCESGVIPADLECVISDPTYDLLLPLDLGSWEISCLGGNASTNARGIRTLKYMDFRHSIVGLEAVLPNGEILNVMDGSHKDPVGVDLKHCFIGTEGIFGIITKLAIRCPPRPRSTNAALITCDDYASVLEILRTGRRDLADTLSAFEYMDNNALGVVEREMNLRIPVAENNNESSRQGCRHAIFIEISSSALDCHELITKFINKIQNRKLCNSTFVPLTKEDMVKLWRARKVVVDACKDSGLVFKFDLKIPARHVPELVHLFETVSIEDRIITSVNESIQRAPDGSGNLARIKDLIVFGQLPTGNLHVVATIDPHSWEIEKKHSIGAQRYAIPECIRRLQLVLCRWLRSNRTASSGGFLSLSRECDGRWMRWVHRLEIDETGASADGQFPGRDLQVALKNAWDPKGIMNPYKTFPFTTF